MFGLLINSSISIIILYIVEPGLFGISRLLSESFFFFVLSFARLIDFRLNRCSNPFKVFFLLTECCITFID